jgi:hypothetical protein
MGKLRILNTKTGEVKFREAHIANNAKLLKTYGYILQDLGEKEPEKNGLDVEKLKEEYEKLTCRKAGNKKPETIAKEIEELNKNI